ncbi:hypothetical protein B0A55_13672, partial [Friedmanniomyces simplex]
MSRVPTLEDAETARSNSETIRGHEVGCGMCRARREAECPVRKKIVEELLERAVSASRRRGGEGLEGGEQ